jgi:predicted adenylyl cyclase CyaB
MKQGTYTEFEAKFYPVNKEEFRERLRKIDAKLVIPERKMVRLVADWRENPVLSNRECIRVRNEGKVIRLSFKTFADDPKEVTDQEEIETEVGNFDATVKILKQAGLKFNRKQETLREEWRYNEVQITIDTWPGLQAYTEIEGDSEMGVKEVAAALGFDWDNKLVMPASGLYSKVYGISEEQALEGISSISFDNIPFKGMKKIWPQ